MDEQCLIEREELKRNFQKIRPLEDLCLNKIAQRFCFLYRYNDAISKTNLEFLLRFFTYEITSKLYIKDDLCVDNLKVLMNEHLRILNGKWLSNRFNTRLRHYHVDTSTLITDIQKIICSLKNLTIVCFSDLCNDEILKNIAKFCHEIVTIDVRNSKVTDNGLKYLCNDENGQVPCSKLKKILIHDTNVTEEGIKCLIQKLKLLEVVDSPLILYALYSLYRENFDCNVKNTTSYNLAFLDISKLEGMWNANILNVCFTLCPKIDTFACSVLEQEQVTVIKNDIQKLYLKFIKRGRNININPFLIEKGSNLTFLNIYNCTMAFSVLVKSCPKLERLCLSNIIFLDDNSGDSLFNNFEYLNELVLKYVKDESSTNKAVSRLLSSENLYSVSFGFCDMSVNLQTIVLKYCRNIKFFSFECLIVQGRFIANVLLNSSSLIDLNLKCCDLCGFDYGVLHEIKEIVPNKPVITINRCT